MLAKKSSRPLALLLTIVMLFSLLPMSALAITLVSDAQIERNGASPLYHTLNTAGESTGSSTTASVTSRASDPKVEISKTIEGTSEENVFDITLTVKTRQKTSTTITSPDAAAVLVIDSSTSMNGTKLTSAKAAAINFAKTFAADANGAHRYIAVVQFDEGSSTLIGWTDAATLTWAATPDNSITKKINALTTANYTNPEAGLQIAYNLMNLTTVSGVAATNKFVVLLTDGSPNAYLGSVTDRTTNTTGFPTSKVNIEYNNNFGSTTAANKAGAVAANITGTGTNQLGIKLYSVCYGASNDRIGGTSSSYPTVLTWLTSISTRCFSADNTDQLNQSFDSIIKQIQLITKAWTVSDPMGQYIVFDTDYNGRSPRNIAVDSSSNIRNFSTASNTLVWNLNGETHTTTGSTGNELYTYTLTYRVSLNTAASGFAENQYYLTNGVTSLSYAFYNESGKLLDENGNLIYNTDGSVNSSSDRVTTLRTLSFKVPAVKGEVPDAAYTIQYFKKVKTTGTYPSTPTDTTSGTAKLWSTVNAPSGYADKYSSDNYAFAGGDISKQLTTLTGNVLKLYYDPIMVSATVNHYYKTITIAADGSSDEATATYGPAFSVPYTNLYKGDSFTAPLRDVVSGIEYELVAADSDPVTISSLTESNDPIDLYYVRTVDNRVGANVKVQHVYNTYEWVLSGGVYTKEARSTGPVETYDSTTDTGADWKAYDTYTATKDTAALADGYSFTGATATNGIVSGTDTTTVLAGGDNVITLSYLKDVPDPAGATITINHYYTLNLTTIDPSTNQPTTAGSYVNQLGATDSITTEYVGEYFAATSANYKTGYDGRTFVPNATQSLVISSLSGDSDENVINIYYSLTVTPAAAEITVNHIYRTVTKVYDADHNVIDYTYQTDDTQSVDYPAEGGVLYVGEAFQAPLQSNGSYVFNEIDSDSRDVILEAHNAAINLYYDTNVEGRDDASIKVKHTYITELETASGTGTVVNDRQDGYTEDTYEGYQGDTYTPEAEYEYGLNTYTLRSGSLDARTLTAVGPNGTIELVYERQDSDLTPATLTVTHHYLNRTMSVQNGVAGYYSPAEEVGTSTSYTIDSGSAAPSPLYAGQSFSVDLAPMYDSNTYTAKSDNPNTDVILTGTNTLDLYYTRDIPLGTATIEVNHYYTETVYSYPGGVEHTEVFNTAASDNPYTSTKYLGEGYTATKLLNGFTFDHATATNGFADEAALQIVTAAGTNVINLYYVKDTNKNTASITVNHVYTDYDWKGDIITSSTNTSTGYGYALSPFTVGYATQSGSYTVVGKEVSGAYTEDDSGITLTALAAGSENSITINYERTVETREATRVIVKHYYTTHDVSGLVTPDTVEEYDEPPFTAFSEGVWVGHSFTAPLRVKYPSETGNTYNFVSADPEDRTITELAAVPEGEPTPNIITINYSRDYDSRLDQNYDFIVHYVNGHTSETLGEDVRGRAPYGMAMNETLVGNYLENSGWLNDRRPSGYKSGSAEYITISENAESNVIVVTYNYNGGGGGGDDTPTYFTVHYQFNGDHPDVTLPADKTYTSGKTVQVADGYDDVTTSDGVWHFSGWSKTGEFRVTGNTTITGKWTYTPNETSIDEEEPPLIENPPTEQPGEVEVVDEETPLGNLPQTGTTQADLVKPMWTLAMMALAFSMVSAGLTITFTRKKEEEEHSEN